MKETAQLHALEQIKLLKARYCRGADTKNEALFRSVFAPDVVFDIRGATTDPSTGINPIGDTTGSVLKGADEVVSLIFANLPDSLVHQCFMPEIEFIDADNAKGIWAMEDILRWREGPAAEMHGYGHYHETYRRISGEWKISSVGLTRTRLDLMPRK